jgi:phage tail protein X
VAEYLTKDGDMLDAICWKYYGNSEFLNKVLAHELNRELAKHGPILPAGIIINLPKFEAPSKKRRVSLW